MMFDGVQEADVETAGFLLVQITVKSRRKYSGEFHGDGRTKECQRTEMKTTIEKQ